MQAFLARHSLHCFGTTHEVVQPVPARTVSRRPRTIPFRRTSPPQPDNKPWKPRDGYIDIKELAHGSEAKTYLTKSISTGRIYVVKRFSDYVVFNHKTSSQRNDQPLPNEATVLLKTLRPHPNILQVFGCDLSGARRSNVYTDFCDAGDLADQLDHHQKLNRTPPERYVLHVLISLAEALAYIHHGLRWDPEMKRYWQEPGFNTPIVHGDIKCDNVFLRWSARATQLGLPEVILGDFGQAQPANYFRGIAGTTGYQAPEAAVVYGLKQTDIAAYRTALTTIGYMMPAADMYSLGQTVLMTSTAKLHVVGADPETTPVQETKNRVVGVQLGGRRGYDTEALTKVVQWCLKTDPSNRPKATEESLLASIAVLREALEEKMANAPRIPDEMWTSPPPTTSAGV